MFGYAKRVLPVVGVLLTALVGTTTQADTSGQQRVVERARLALDAFLDDPNFEMMRVYVQNAYGVLIIPEMLRGGFFFGAQHGVGVLMTRDPGSGEWSQPAFYTVYGGSFGLQFGGQSSDVVLTIMNQGAVNKLVSSNVKLKFGADAGLAVGRVGAGIGAGTTLHFGEDIYAFAKSRGLYGGFTIDGTVVVPNDDWNRAYYGRPVEPQEIVRSRTLVASNGVESLHHALTRF